MATTTAEPVLDAVADHGEGPLWDDRTSRLAWVDTSGRAVHLGDPASGADVTMAVDQQVGAVALRASGGLVVAVQDGLVTWSDDDLAAPGDDDPPSRSVDVAVPLEADDATTRTNDGAADPHGRYWIGTTELDHGSPAGVLYRVDPDRSVHPELHDLTISNGIAWERDGATAYFIDTPTGRVDRLLVDADSGDLVERVPHLDVSDAPGHPDGMTIDVEGGLWIAFFDGWQVRRYDPAGELDVVVELPVPHVTACVHGGPDLRDLFITTSRRDLDDDERARHPRAGSVFHVEVDVPGHPPDRVAF